MIPNITGGRRRSRRGPLRGFDFTRNDVAIDGRIAFARADATTCAARTGKWGITAGVFGNNRIRNSKAHGAHVGNLASGGALPTNWSFEGNFQTMTREVVARGEITLAGEAVPYVDIRMSGVTDASGDLYGNIVFDTATFADAAQGESWIESCYVALVAGSFANVTNGGPYLSIFERTAAGAYLANTSTLFVPNATLTRYSSAVRVMASASTGKVNSGLNFDFANSVALDFTLRIAGPQLDKSAALRSLAQTGPQGYQTLAATVAANVPRLDYDPVTLACKGLLLEPSRINKLTTANCNPTSGFGTTVVVDDTAALTAAGLLGACTNGDVYMLDNSGGGATAYMVFAGPTGNTNAHTLSVYYRSTGGSCTLQYSVSGNGPVALPASAGYVQAKSANVVPSTAGNAMQIAVPAGTVLWAILQRLEEGAYITSPIVNTTGAVTTRAAESAAVTNLAAVGWNATGWSGYVEWTQGATLGRVGDFGRIFEFSDNTANNAIFLYQNNGTDSVRLNVYIGGAQQGQINFGSIAAGTTCRIAFRLTPTGFAASLNGGALQSVVCTVPMSLMTKLNLCGAYNSASNSYGDGWLRKFNGWSRPLSDAELIEEAT